MAYVIAEPCIDELDQSCVTVCPVDCIHFEDDVDRKRSSTPTSASTAAPASRNAR